MRKPEFLRLRLRFSRSLDGSIAAQERTRGAKVILFVCACLALTWAGVVLYLNLTAFRSRGIPIGWDFVQHYAASVLALDGSAPDAYDARRIAEVEKEISGFEVGLAPFFLLWNYPPSFLLLIAPLSLLPYAIALLLWVAGSFTLYLAVVYCISRRIGTVMLVAASPAVFWTFLHGQNSFFFAAILGTGLALLNTRPFLAGLILGVLTCKPQLCLLVPIALLGARMWKALSGMCVATGLLAVGSALVFQPRIWWKFVGSLDGVLKMMAGGQVPYEKTMSVAAACLTLRCPIATALAIQALASVIASVLVARIWWRSKGTRKGYITLITMSAMAAPYILVHDLAILGIASAYIWRRNTGESCADTILGGVLWGLPFFCVYIAAYTGVQLAGFVLLAAGALYSLETGQPGGRMDVAC